MERPPFIVLAAGGLLAAVVAVALIAPADGAWRPQPAYERADNQPISTAEAEAWAEARAADTDSAYRVYLAAFPDGAFSDDARAALGEETRDAAPLRQAQAAATPVVHRPSRAQIAASCQSFVDANWPAPSRVARIGGGAAAGCGVGALAGGDDGRNCAIGAVAGGVTGEVTARSRERRREREYSACMANGGPG